MAEHGAQTGATEFETLIEAAKKELDADATRLLRAMRAIPADDPDAVTLQVFAAIATARRHAFKWFGRIRNLDADDPGIPDALAALSTLAAALGSWYRGLRTSDLATRRRENRLATERFATAARVFEQLGKPLGETP